MHSEKSFLLVVWAYQQASSNVGDLLQSLSTLASHALVLGVGRVLVR